MDQPRPSSFSHLLLLLLQPFLVLLTGCSSATTDVVAAAASSTAPLHVTLPPPLSFDDAYTPVFGDSNLAVVRDGMCVHISLDERTGAGFASQEMYLHGFFSASIKLPPHYAAGVVVALYMSNGDLFEENHDELDFEFLGNVRGKEWRVQTNVYGNGSTGIGREERYGLPFDPTEEFHQYSILWTNRRIVFYIDSIPIREILRSHPTVAFPSRPMSLYATIWDGSDWATSGGRYRVNYKYAPYVAEFSDLIIDGCAIDPIDHSSTTCDVDDSGTTRLYAAGNDDDASWMPAEQRAAMLAFREEYMAYSYCYDRDRYSSPLPECNITYAAATEVLRLSSTKGRAGHRRQSNGGVRLFGRQQHRGGIKKKKHRLGR